MIDQIKSYLWKEHYIDNMTAYLDECLLSSDKVRISKIIMDFARDLSWSDTISTDIIRELPNRFQLVDDNGIPCETGKYIANRGIFPSGEGVAYTTKGVNYTQDHNLFVEG